MKPDETLAVSETWSMGGYHLPNDVFDAVLLPPRETIPEEYFKQSNPWNKFTSDLFFNGGKLHHLKEREGVDRDKAIRHIKYVLKSFRPEHNHKIAAVAHLFDLWFTK